MAMVNFNVNVDAVSLWDKSQRAVSRTIEQGRRVANVTRRAFMREKLALLKRGLEGTGYKVDIPQLTGPTIITIATLAAENSPFAQALQAAFSDDAKRRLGLSQWCRMASFNADPTVVLGVTNPSEGELAAQASVLNALEHRGVNHNHAWQIFVAALDGGASAIIQNLSNRGVSVIEFDLVVELMASANGETVLGRLTKYKGPDPEAMIKRVMTRLHKSEKTVNGRVQLDLQSMTKEMRGGSVDPEAYLRIRSRRVQASLPSQGAWYRFAVSVAATNIIMHDLSEQNTGELRALLSAVFPEESCLRANLCSGNCCGKVIGNCYDYQLPNQLPLLEHSMHGVFGN